MKFIFLIIVTILSIVINCQESPLQEGAYRKKNLLYLLGTSSIGTPINLKIIFSGSCNYSPSQKYCTNMYYGYMIESSLSYVSNEICSRISGFGISQTDPCPIKDFVGACYVSQSIASRKLEVYYSPEFTKESAEERCQNGSNSSIQPPYEERKPHHTVQFLDSYDGSFLPSLELR